MKSVSLFSSLLHDTLKKICTYVYTKCPQTPSKRFCRPTRIRRAILNKRAQTPFTNNARRTGRGKKKHALWYVRKIIIRARAFTTRSPRPSSSWKIVGTGKHADISVVDFQTEPNATITRTEHGWFIVFKRIR